MEIRVEKQNAGASEPEEGRAEDSERGASSCACAHSCDCGNGMRRCAPRGMLWRAVGGALAVFLIALTVGEVAELWKVRKSPPAGFANRTITLSAAGKAMAMPDTAEVQLSVLTEGATPENVQKENTRKMNDVIAFVRSLGIEAKDMQTANYSLYPKYEYAQGKSRINGYTLTQMLRVLARDSEKIGLILEGATARGVNQVGDVRFFIDDPDEPRSEARKEALRKIRRKAEEMTDVAGVRLGRLITVSEAGEPQPPVFYTAAERGVGGGEAPLPQIEPGMQEIAVTISATYAIE